MRLEFRKIDSDKPVAKYLAAVISKRLNDGQRVLWMVTGGSAIAVAVEACQLLGDTPLEKLTVTLTDERFGQVGHADSNWKQLKDSGFAAPGALLIPVLDGQDLAATRLTFDKNLRNALETNDFRLALLGVGPDGHVAGLLPGSPALSSPDFAAAFTDDEVPGESPEGVKRGLSRITITIPAIIKMDELVVYAMGESKRSALDGLEINLPVETQPVQVLKQAKKIIVFNDYKGDAE
ncbi:MAG: 6-phosphogluconolactonase [Patescibacteria group bacterium]